MLDGSHDRIVNIPAIIIKGQIVFRVNLRDNQWLRDQVLTDYHIVCNHNQSIRVLHCPILDHVQQTLSIISAEWNHHNPLVGGICEILCRVACLVENIVLPCAAEVTGDRGIFGIL
jgi:hypothetical protein